MPLYRSLFEQIPESTPGRDELGSWLDEADDFRIQSGLVHIILPPCKDVLTDAQLSHMGDCIRQVAPNPMVKTTAKNSFALLGLLASLIAPEVPLRTSCNDVFETVYRDASHIPAMKIMLKVCENRWDLYIRDSRHWEKLFWDVESDIERVGPRCIRSHVPTPFAIYNSPGFNRAMLQVFGLEGECRVLEANVKGSVFETHWR